MNLVGFAVRTGLVMAVVVAGCGRTQLDDLYVDDSPATPAARDAGRDAGSDGDGGADAGLDRAPDLAADRAGMDLPSPPSCQPSAEACNGVDDDCDGQVDEGLTPIPCEGGGSRYCIAGRLSECPRRCRACVPGGRRTCFVSYCTYWGVETCAADGSAFGACREEMVPRECAAVARKHQKSPELEQCCLDAGYCCRDDFDLDRDGNRGEMLGRCDQVQCGP